MHKSFILSLSIFLVGFAHAQSINVRGKITDASNMTISNASVELLSAKQKTTSGIDGMYSLTRSTSIDFSAPGSFSKIDLNQGVLELYLVQPAIIRIEIFDAKGNGLDRTMLEKGLVGKYQFDLNGHFPGSPFLVVKASIGKETKTFPYLVSAREGQRKNISNHFSTRSLGKLAKIAAIVDTLKVSATGFAVKNIPISSYDTTVNVSLSNSSDRWGGLGNPAGPSAGCGKAIGILKTGKNKITTGGVQRDYIIDIPTDYKPDHPYRLFFCFHWYGGSADSIASGQAEFGRGGGPENYAYYGLKPLATKAKDPAIFIAPQGLNNGWGGAEKDQAFFDDMLTFAKGNLCIDTTRVFSTGFSFGSMFTYSLTTNHQKQIRAGVGIAPANWNIWLPNPLPRDPIAWMQTTGMSDESCKWMNDASKQLGAKYIALQRGQDNGCAVPSDIPTTTIGSKTHQCYDFTSCKQGYPVKACTFDGGHIANVGDGGTGNVGKDSWIPAESWKFFTQF